MGGRMHVEQVGPKSLHTRSSSSQIRPKPSPVLVDPTLNLAESRPKAVETGIDCSKACAPNETAGVHLAVNDSSTDSAVLAATGVHAGDFRLPFDGSRWVHPGGLSPGPRF